MVGELCVEVAYVAYLFVTQVAAEEGRVRLVYYVAQLACGSVDEYLMLCSRIVLPCFTFCAEYYCAILALLHLSLFVS